MSKKMLYLLVGPAGSGKSTWIKNHATPGHSARISRDRIRFKMVHPDDYYFSREDDVYEEFIAQCAEALASDWVDNVYVDATHLTQKTRLKVLSDIQKQSYYDFDVTVIILKTSLETCLTQNAQREGRERVPDNVIRNMYKAYEDPWDDNYEYSGIAYIEEGFNVEDFRDE